MQKDEKPTDIVFSKQSKKKVYIEGFHPSETTSASIFAVATAAVYFGHGL